MHRTALTAILLCLCSCATPPAGQPSEQPAGPPPNFVIIFIDDMGYGDIGPFGSTINRTPHLDQMAAEGMKLTSFYAAPVCTPSRAALMTGSYPIRNGLQTGSWHPVLMPGDTQGIHADEITVAEVLKQQGYATGIIGKWHLGDQPAFLPNQHGFDYHFGLPYSNDMSPFLPRNSRNHPPLALIRNGEVIREVPEDQSFLTGSYTEEAVTFIEQHQKEPFFLYLPHSMVHVPLFAGDDFRGKSGNGILGDAIEELDWSVGQVLGKLRDLGLAENTLVLFTSDNGPARGSAGPLRGRKGDTWEGGMREPTIAWWPGTVPPGASYDSVASTMDVLPTFARLAGTSAPTDRTIDGHDISAILKGDLDQPSAYDAFYYYRGYELRAVRSGKWKLHTTGELYDLDGDIGETSNVSVENSEVVERLEGLLENARAELGDGPVWPIDPGIKLPPTARPIGRIENPKLLIPRHGKTGDAAHEPPIQTKTTPPPPKGWKPPANW